MFENTSLQELYTGSLIAGKGKMLNNIKVIMERSKFRTEDWARVRFGAGTPWRRCWCVIDPPNEKEFQKEQKSLKKKSAYDRPVVLKGDIKFYDTKKTKKVTPIATITDAYSAYAIYPQSKPLIEQSTLVKVEGRITIHSTPESKTEGFVFVMPEAHPAVSGFEMMLRWLFPVYDAFGLYGRPNRLIADTLDSRGIMFAMPKERRYGYVDIQDVAALVCTEGSQGWSEEEWRKQLKDVTSKRLSSTGSRMTSRQGSRSGIRASLPAGTNLRYEDGASIRSTRSQRHKHNRSTDTVFATPPKTHTAPPSGSLTSANYHARSASDTLAFANSPRKREQYVPSRLSTDQEPAVIDRPPALPVHGMPHRRGRPGDLELPKAGLSFDNEQQPNILPESEEVGSELRPQPPPTPVAAPPAFLHSPGERPSLRPNASPELRRANSRMSITTLSQLVDASKSGSAAHDPVAAAGAAAAWKQSEGLRNRDQVSSGVNETTNRRDSPADQRLRREGLVAGSHKENSRTTSPRAPERSHSAQRPDELIDSSPEKAVARKPLRADPAQTVSSQIPTETEGVEGHTRASTTNDPLSDADDSRMTPSQPSLAPDPNHGTAASMGYAGGPESAEGRKSDLGMPKQQTGASKTAGLAKQADNTTKTPSDVLNVHKATTQSYSPGVGKSSSALGPRNASPRWDHSRTPSDSLTPKDDRRSSYLGGVTPNGVSDSRSPSRSPNTSDRAVPWQPGSSAIGQGRKSPGPGISAEEFVQQRASASRVVSPMYAHQKNRSSGNLPQERPVSADRPKRRAVGSRPSSGDVQTILAQQQDYSSHLSAKEQEQVARWVPLRHESRRRNRFDRVSRGRQYSMPLRRDSNRRSSNINSTNNIWLLSKLNSRRRRKLSRRRNKHTMHRWPPDSSGRHKHHPGACPAAREAI